MAGIYIPGIELPEKGKHLHLRIDADGTICGQINSDPYFCNLIDFPAMAIPVPDHGDLIDRDKLRELGQYDWDIDDVVVLLSDIDEAPTIIPADPGKEDAP